MFNISVDTILSDLNKAISRLEKLASDKISAEVKSLNLAAQHSQEAFAHRMEATRASAVSDKLKELIS